MNVHLSSISKVYFSSNIICMNRTDEPVPTRIIRVDFLVLGSGFAAQSVVRSNPGIKIMMAELNDVMSDYEWDISDGSTFNVDHSRKLAQLFGGPKSWGSAITIPTKENLNTIPKK